MGDELIGTIWVCQCCTLDDANGECCEDDQHGGDGIAPWSRLVSGEHVFMGLSSDEHAEGCTEDVRASGGCECESRTFSSSQCEGCGSWLAGSRHAFGLYRDAASAPHGLSVWGGASITEPGEVSA